MNDRSLKCYVCGSILVPGSAQFTPIGINLPYIGGGINGGYQPTLTGVLECPSGHNYHLNLISNFNYNRTSLNFDTFLLMKRSQRQLGGLSPEKLLDHPTHKAYMIGFSRSRRFQSYFSRKVRVFNSSLPLDSVSLLVSVIAVNYHIILTGIANTNISTRREFDFVIVNSQLETM